MYAFWQYTVMWAWASLLIATGVAEKGADNHLREGAATGPDNPRVSVDVDWKGALSPTASGARPSVAAPARAVAKTNSTMFFLILYF